MIFWKCSSLLITLYCMTIRTSAETTTSVSPPGQFCTEDDFSPWSTWSSCSATCDEGSQFRTRSCNGAITSGIRSCIQQKCRSVEALLSEFQCSPGIEVSFLIDASGSVGENNFLKVQNFTQDVTRQLKSQYEKLNLTIITFNNEAKVSVSINESHSLEEILNAEKALVYTHGGTETHKALQLLYKSLMQKNSTSPKVAVVITDGASFQPDLTKAAAKLLKDSGVTIIVLGVGDDLNPYELSAVSSDPDEKYLFRLDNFNELSSLIGLFSHQKCPVSTTVMSTVTTRITSLRTKPISSLPPTTVTNWPTEPSTPLPTTTITPIPNETTKRSSTGTDAPQPVSERTPTARPVVVSTKIPTLRPSLVTNKPLDTASPAINTMLARTSETATTELSVTVEKSPAATRLTESTFAPIDGTQTTISTTSLFQLSNATTSTTAPTAPTTTSALETSTTRMTPRLPQNTETPATRRLTTTTDKTTTTIGLVEETDTTAPTTITVKQSQTTKLATHVSHDNGTTSHTSTATFSNGTTSTSSLAQNTETTSPITSTSATSAKYTDKTPLITSTVDTSDTTTIPTYTTDQLPSWTYSKKTTTVLTTTPTSQPLQEETTTVPVKQHSDTHTTVPSTSAMEVTTTGVKYDTSTETTQTTAAPRRSSPTTEYMTTHTEPATITTAESTTMAAKSSVASLETTTMRSPATQLTTNKVTEAQTSSALPQTSIMTETQTTTTTQLPNSATPVPSITVTRSPFVFTTRRTPSSTKTSTTLPPTTITEDLISLTQTEQETTPEQETTSTEPPTTTTASCIAKVADVVFVVDTSGSIGRPNFERIKEFIKDVVLTFDVDYRYTRVGLIEFSTTPKIEFKLFEKNNITELLDAIDNITYSGGGTSTSDALELMRLEGFERERPLAPDIAVVITDGLSKFPQLTKVQAQLARADGIAMFSIGIGNQTSSEELQAIASSPGFVFQVGDYQTLFTLDSVVAHRACGVILPEEYHTRSSTPSTTTHKGCIDIDAQCPSYPRDSCSDFEPWARRNCPRKCGFCPGFPLVEPPCEDTIGNCVQYGTSMCSSTSQYEWVDSHCRKFCGFCGNKTDSMTTSTTEATTSSIGSTASSCSDIQPNCANYEGGKAMCIKFGSWARNNCAKYCGYCFTYETVTSITVNNIRCPEWKLPDVCTLEQSDGHCCPMPKCPSELRLTVKRT